MSTYIPGRTSPISGVYVLPNDTSEHDVVEILNTTGVVQDFVIRFSLREITKANFKLRLYMKTDGTNYDLHTPLTFGISNNIGQFKEDATAYSLKVTAQSQIAEGATRNLPYKYTLVPQ